MSADSNSKYSISVGVAVVLLLVYFLFFKDRHPQSPTPPTLPTASALSNDHGYRHHRLHYTKHARCRMNCRHIDEVEVNEILQNGEINNRKSELNATPCPKYALEGITKEHQHLRIIVGDCDQEATIITVIDLEHEFACDCH